MNKDLAKFARLFYVNLHNKNTNKDIKTEKMIT